MEYKTKVNVIKALLGGPRYCDIPENTRLEELAGKIAAAHQWRGEAYIAETVAGFASALDRAVMESFGTLALREVTLAIRWGMRGEWGDYTAVTPDNLFRFVRTYAASDERAEAVELRVRERALPPAPKNDPLMASVLASYRRSMAEAERARTEARRRAAVNA